MMCLTCLLAAPGFQPTLHSHPPQEVEADNATTIAVSPVSGADASSHCKPGKVEVKFSACFVNSVSRFEDVGGGGGSLIIFVTNLFFRKTET
jgi:hypothetical protein